MMATGTLYSWLQSLDQWTNFLRQLVTRLNAPIFSERPNRVIFVRLAFITGLPEIARNLRREGFPYQCWNEGVGMEGLMKLGCRVACFFLHAYEFSL